jgi:hypothetical protein
MSPRVLRLQKSDSNQQSLSASAVVFSYDWKEVGICHFRLIILPVKK